MEPFSIAVSSIAFPQLTNVVVEAVGAVGLGAGGARQGCGAVGVIAVHVSVTVVVEIVGAIGIGVFVVAEIVVLAVRIGAIGQGVIVVVVGVGAIGG